MTSQAQDSFTGNCGDIDRLFEIHRDITGDQPGRRWQQVESLHKAAFVLLTAFWEAFCEDLAAEALDHLVTHANSATALPKDLQKLVAKELKSDPNELAVWNLADGGWRTVLSSRLAKLQEERNRRLNTPKTAQINELFEKAVGIKDISKSWHWTGMKAARAAEKLDGFITLRGEIAHRGSAASSVTKPQVEAYYNHVWRLVQPTESHVEQALLNSTGTQPWS